MQIFLEKIKSITTEANEYNILKEDKIPNQWNRRHRMYANTIEITSIAKSNNMNVSILVLGLTNLRLRQ
jgi:hypothetical protein